MIGIDIVLKFVLEIAKWIFGREKQIEVKIQEHKKPDSLVVPDSDIERELGLHINRTDN